MSGEPTPGPWERHGWDVFACGTAADGGDQHIAMVSHGLMGNAEFEANAELIAAAPSLQATLEENRDDLLDVRRRLREATQDHTHDAETMRAVLEQAIEDLDCVRDRTDDTLDGVEA